MEQIDISHLRGTTVYLEPLLAGHVPVLKAIGKDERIWELTKTILVNDEYDQQFDQYISMAIPSSEAIQAFIIRQVSDDSIIGMTRFYDIDNKNRRLNIGYTWYIPSVWGKVHNKECKLLLLQYVFEVWQFNRVGFEVAHQNIRSQKAVEKIGGIKEGMLRKYAYRADGSIRHTVIYSIIDDEWAEKKKGLLSLIKNAL